MRHGTCRPFIGALLFLSALPAFAQTDSPSLPKGVQKVASVEGITEYRLANGLRILLFPDLSKPTITVNITYLVGSKHENYGETGMAHLLEHLVFKGTPRHPNIPQELTSHGARPNGSTWWDRTNYFETFSATDENLNWALDLEADRMVNSFIAQKDLDSEMTVVRNEFEMGENSPGAVLEERTMATAYLWHNYGNTTIGARSDIEGVPIDRLQAFYKKYYQPDHAVLVITGHIDEAKTLALATKYFAPIPKPARDIVTPYTVEPTQDGEREVIVRRSGDVQLVHCMYHMPAASHSDAGAIDVLTEVLSSSPSGRLYRALVEAKKAAAVNGTFYALREPGFAIFRAEVRHESPLHAARAALVETIETFAAKAATDEEVERAKTTLLKNIEWTLHQSDRLGLRLSEWIAAGDWRLFFLHRDRIRNVTANDLKRVAAAYLKPSNRTVGLFIPTPSPDRAEIPTAPVVAELVRGYRGDPELARGEAFDPSPGNIESRTRRIDLPNGAKVALLSKETRGDTVVATMTLRFGGEQSLMNQATIADVAAAMLMRGTSRRTRQQIKDEFDTLKARVYVGGGAPELTVSVETVRKHLPAVLALLCEVLRDPAFPEKEFKALRQERLARIEDRKSEPSFLGRLAFRRHLNPYPKGDVRYIATVDESIEELRSVKLDEVKNFHRAFYGASNANLALVGDFDEREITELTAKLFGEWKSPMPFRRVPQLFHHVEAAHRSIETPDKANAFFIAGHSIRLRDDHPDYPALVLGNFMLGGGFLNSRLATRIRQKEGLSYGVGSQLSAGSLDETGAFLAYAIYAPENGTKIEAAFREELEKVFNEGFTVREVAEAKSGWLQSRQLGRSQDSTLCRTLESYLFLGRTLSWDAEFEKKLEALTPSQIHEAVKRHLDLSKMTIVKAGDFNNRGPKKE
ncbi:MAG: insulinase family protein [Planctomycetes bacterium]|nr:insulinase family protein [Planctomycetota bacterium]